ncbi:uncharacterized protein LOC62_06G008027 [Vanrija pseudolonga]|uniref:Uncharacterized protein n=1 Tax=Vanrija pseudolonga TaxID=143232 RepID=A0AAF1BTA3_9TREE|nr:hypothetical protein LOC62_06G008027 [Vanrija pseudolonga]
MGYSILMQWTPAAQPRGSSISDLLLSRVLEHYNITHPLRSTIQFRTFRASFPTPDKIPALGEMTVPTPSAATRILTTVTYSQSIPPVRDVPVPTGARDDVTYLFLEDRDAASAANGAKAPEAKKDDTKDEAKKDSGLNDDGFEILEPKALDGVGSESTPMDVDAAPATVPEPPKEEPKPPRPVSKYKILAVRPATLVMPTLHNLLSPFVLGLSKSARAAASTTAQAATPTPLTGTPLVLTTLAFPPTAHPQPALSLSVHILPNASAQTILLEGEWEGARAEEGGGAEAVLREFLLGCVPEGVVGETKFFTWAKDGGSEDPTAGGAEGWVGVEKSRRMTMLLARALRESSFI